MTAKTKSKQPKPKTSSAKTPVKEESIMDERGHKRGSRKAVVHALFDTADAETAFARGTKLGLKKGTLLSWFGHWRRAAGKAAKTAKAKASKVEKTATKPTETTQPTIQ